MQMQMQIQIQTQKEIQVPNMYKYKERVRLDEVEALYWGSDRRWRRIMVTTVAMRARPSEYKNIKQKLTLLEEVVAESDTPHHHNHHQKILMGKVAKNNNFSWICEWKDCVKFMRSNNIWSGLEGVKSCQNYPRLSWSSRNYRLKELTIAKCCTELFGNFYVVTS